jgi:hypothetical protein
VTGFRSFGRTDITGALGRLGFDKVHAEFEGLAQWVTAVKP